MLELDMSFATSVFLFLIKKSLVLLNKTRETNMAQIILAKMEVQVEIKSSAQRFYDIFRSKQHLLPKICPDMEKDVKVIKGDWESVGSIKQWSYVAGILWLLLITVNSIKNSSLFYFL